MALIAIWTTGWLVSVIVGLFFNPLVSEEEKRKDFRGRLLANCVINCVLWPWLLPEILKRQKLYRHMRSGKRPSWIVLAKGEADVRYWTLSDETEFGASVSGGSSSEPSRISADYDDDSITGQIEYRIRMIAPSVAPPTDWARLEFTPRGPEPEPDDEDAVDAFNADRYEISAQMPRGKYLVEFRVPNRSGRVEECSGVTLIVAELEDYNL